MQETIVEKDCKVSAKDFYDTLLISSVQEAEEAVGYEINVKDIKEGYHYRRDTEKHGEEIVTYKRLLPGREYAIKVSRGTKNIQMRFRLEKKDENSCHVVLSQTIMTNKKPDWFSTMIMKKRLKDRLNLIEKGAKDRLAQESGS